MLNEKGVSRRSFLKGAFAFGAVLPLGALAACSPSGSASSSSASAAPSGAASTASASAQASASAGASSAAAAGGKVLVAYYSAQGHTQAVAQAAADELGADVFVITPAQPYTSDDLNYNNDSSRVSTEHNNPDGRHVELQTATPDNFADYDTVLVGYPVWWQAASWVVDDFVRGNDFTGKKVIPFCTSASSPLGNSGSLLASMAGTGDWQEGMRFSSSASEQSVREWARSIA